jgi:hypothetical protein
MKRIRKAEEVSLRGVCIRQRPVDELVRHDVGRVIDPVAGDLVPGKRRATILAVHGLRRRRVENLPLQDPLAGAGICDTDRSAQVRAEIAGAVGTKA